MQLALLNQAIDSKLRAGDLLKLRVCEVSSNGSMFDRVVCRQQKTDIDAQFEVTPRNQHTISHWIFWRGFHLSVTCFLASVKTGCTLVTRTTET
ncbi:hypothetical protein OAG1_17600 [Agarivorans sp. OAG1]|nr:hypothetical protein OAG1_17600 [Agarivorans sp. OAG1]